MKQERQNRRHAVPAKNNFLSYATLLLRVRLFCVVPVKEIHAKEVHNARAAVVLHATVLRQLFHIHAVRRHTGKLLVREAAGLPCRDGTWVTEIAAAGAHHDAMADLRKLVDEAAHHAVVLPL